MTEPGAAWGWAVLAVMVGGAFGAVLRYVLNASWGSLRGVLVANVVGSAGLGALVALVQTPVVILLLGAGLCGALTTWSTLAVQTVQLGHRAPGSATLYLLLNLLLGLGAALLALLLLG